MSTPQSYNKVDSASPLNAKDSAVKSNIQALADLFPAAVQEGVVDFDALTRILGGKTEPQPERFGLNWCGKAAAHAGALVDSAGTLRPCREESKDWDTTKNLYIEGDNLEVLKLLRNSYRGKVKMIYIDPPYNTGKDFVYKDNFHDSIKNYQQITGQQNELKENSETCGRYHTDWLNMMYPRLILARELLSENGVIFISIDNNEFANLALICDEIYGSENFIACLHVEMSLTQGMKIAAAQKGAIVKNGEFILIYGKSGGPFMAENLLYDGKSGYDMHFSYTILEQEGQLRLASVLDLLSSDELYVSKTENCTKRTLKQYIKLMDSDNDFRNHIYKNYADRIYQSMMADIVIPASVINQLQEGKVVKYEKYILYQVNGGNIRQLSPLSATLGITNDYEPTYSSRIIRGDMWKGFYSDMMNVAKEGNVSFKNGKKPVRLIKQLLQWGSKKDSLILDFFSGSATTAHAVMQLNLEDGGNRRFIMVQLPETTDMKSESFKAGYKNICEIGKERIHRAGVKIKSEAGEKSAGLDIGFRVYKLDSSNVYAWEPDTKDIEKSLEQAANHLKEERSSEDIMTELMLRFGIMLTNNVEKQECGDTGLEVYNIGCGRHFACLDERLAAHAEEVAHFILEWHKEENPGTHEEEAKDSQVFVVDKAFVGNDAAKKNFCAILSDYGIKQVNAF